jgi:hypothetical protein
MSKRLFDIDPLTGKKEYWHWDDENQRFTIETEQDVTDLLDLNKAQYNDASSSFKGDMHKVASIPMNIYMDLKQKGIIDDAKKFKAWLNDPDNRYFRTKPGRV